MNNMSPLYGSGHNQPCMPLSAGDSHIDGFDINEVAMDGGMVNSTLDPTMLSFSADSTVQNLDEIINRNNINMEMIRRRQTFNPQQMQQIAQNSGRSQSGRRSSMLEFGQRGGMVDLTDFQFDPGPQLQTQSSQISNPSGMQQPQNPRKGGRGEGLSLETQLSMDNLDGMNMSAYPGLMGAQNMGMNDNLPFLRNSMDMNGDFDGMSNNIAQMNMSPSHSGVQSMYATSPLSASFPLTYPTMNHDPGGLEIRGQLQNLQNVQRPHVRMPTNAVPPNATPRRMLQKSSPFNRTPMIPGPLALSAQNSMSSVNGMQNPVDPGVQAQLAQQAEKARRTSLESTQLPLNTFPKQPHNDTVQDLDGEPPQVMKSKWANAYSSTGFDMLSILMRVATRPNPQINIGPVDLACAFVVCDIQKHDLPIVYCSDMFERLTGYSRHEILGRNCRFLQAPDGKVQSGIRRKYVDDQSVLYLKNQINRRVEAQLSVINYRKGGQPFMNLLTMIPVTWDTEEFRFYVGFQVDLVEQPNSVSAKNPDGTYEINYNRSALPAYRLPVPDHSAAIEYTGASSVAHGGPTISRDEVSQVLTTIGNGSTDLSRRIWDKVLLENADDVVHVLSLKGLFLYLSPSSKAVLEYDPTELVGTALSAVCHPSDIVPVTRELKDSAAGAPVNVVYRIRRKSSGYTWFEAHGCLHTEQGKGRKCIILVGRQRPVYALDRSELFNTNNDSTNEKDKPSPSAGGDAELWTKMSTTGMFLYVSSTSRSMLDRLPDDLVGTSMQALMRLESRKDLGRALELARMGEKSTFKHDMQNRRGQVLQAQTTIYPGDAAKGLKPTFLLGQTRLLKLTRAMLLNQKSAVSISRSGSDLGTPGDEISSPKKALKLEEGATPGGSALKTSTLPTPSAGGSGVLTQAGSGGVPIGNQDNALASPSNIFDELKTTRSTSWQFELRQMERQNRLLAEDLQTLLARRKKRKRRKGMLARYGDTDSGWERDCANCHTRVTPEWRRGPSGKRDLCNSCGLRWAKQNGRVSPRHSTKSDISGTSPAHNQTSNQNSTSVPIVETNGSRLKRENTDNQAVRVTNVADDKTPNANSQVQAQSDNNLMIAEIKKAGGTGTIQRQDQSENQSGDSNVADKPSEESAGASTSYGSTSKSMDKVDRDLSEFVDENAQPG